MKKICISIIILLIILSSTVLAESKNANGTMVKVGNTNQNIDWGKESKIREKLYESTVDEWMKQYMGEEVPENQKITGYKITGFISGNEDEEFFSPVVYVKAEGISEDSIWDKKDNPIHLKFRKVDGEYILESASLYPEKYDEFMEAFEEYEKNKEISIETTGVPADVSYVANSNEIDELRNIIFVGSAIVLLIVIITIIIFKLKKKKK